MKTLFINPFEKYREIHLLSIGGIATLLGTVIAYLLKGRFDGVLDFHLVDDVSITQAIIDTSVNIICLVTFLFIVSKYINIKTRLIDIISVVIIARIPLYFIPLLTIDNRLKNATDELLQLVNPEKITSLHSEIPTEALVIVMLFAILSLFILSWSIVLLYNGYKTATNALGVKAISLFILALLISEICSKIVLFLI